MQTSERSAKPASNLFFKVIACYFITYNVMAAASVPSVPAATMALLFTSLYFSKRLKDWSRVTKVIASVCFLVHSMGAWKSDKMALDREMRLVRNRLALEEADSRAVGDDVIIEFLLDPFNLVKMVDYIRD
jgi:hypothetical protein